MKRIYLDQLNWTELLPRNWTTSVTAWDEMNWELHESTWLIKKQEPVRKWRRLLR